MMPVTCSDVERTMYDITLPCSFINRALQLRRDYKRTLYHHRLDSRSEPIHGLSATVDGALSLPMHLRGGRDVVEGVVDVATARTIGIQQIGRVKEWDQPIYIVSLMFQKIDATSSNAETLAVSFSRRSFFLLSHNSKIRTY